MAKYVVPPRSMSREIILKCFRCKTLYVPEYKHKKSYLKSTDYEDCPICGYSYNTIEQRIPLWQYNLIKYFRGMKDDEQNDNEQADDSRCDD